jgi:hypothetical protein
MTPKTTMEESILGNSLSSHHQYARILHKAKLMIRQVLVFNDATAIRTKNKNQKISTRPSQYLLTTYALSNNLENYTNSYMGAENNTDLVLKNTKMMQKNISSMVIYKNALTTFYHTML